MSRDWQKDMNHLTLERERWQIMNIKTDELDIGIHWLQQYAKESEKKEQYCAWHLEEEKRANDAELLLAAEKERSDKLQTELKAAKEEIARINIDYYADRQRFIDQNKELAELRIRADKATTELKQLLKDHEYVLSVKECHKKKLVEWGNRAIEAEAQVQKLKEALKHCINQYPQWSSKEIYASMMNDYMQSVLSILYPKEAEPK